jgi:hypothetical protein
MLTAIGCAVEAARKSPCAKSRRGAAAIWTSDCDLGTPMAAHNAPPAPLTCGRNAACRAVCGQICNHAEERLILNAARHRQAHAPMCDVLHIEIGADAEGRGLPLPFDREGKPKRPSCITCARIMQHADVRAVWLWGVDGWRWWWAMDFMLETCVELGIAVWRGPQ